MVKKEKGKESFSTRSLPPKKVKNMNLLIMGERWEVSLAAYGRFYEVVFYSGMKERHCLLKIKNGVANAVQGE